MHWTKVQVTWGDTDAGGLIYFPQFFHFFVVGLNAYFAPAADHLMEHLREEGYTLPAVDASASFEAPLRAGDVARVGTAVAALGESSLTVEFAVERAGDGTDTAERADDGTHAADGEVTFVLVDDDFTPAALPESVRACVRQRRQ